MADGYQIQYDETGRPYFQFPGQKRNYVSPVALGGQRPEDTTSILHHGPQWNQHAGKWETPFDWGNFLNIVVGAGLGAGAIDAIAGAGGAAAGGAGAGGGGGATAAPAVLPSTNFTALTPLGGVGVIPPSAYGATGSALAGGLGTGATASAGDAAMNALLHPDEPAGSPPAEGYDPNAPSFPGGGGDTISGDNTVPGLPNAFLTWVKDPKNWAKLAPLIPLLTLAHGGGSGGTGGAPGPGLLDNPGLKSLLDISVNRAQRTDPLHAAVTQLAMSRLPTNMQRQIP